MLFPVDHRLGDSRKSAREVGPSRLFCFTAGFSGSPNGIRFKVDRSHSVPVHNSTATTLRLAGAGRNRPRIPQVAKADSTSPAATRPGGGLRLGPVHLADGSQLDADLRPSLAWA